MLMATLLAEMPDLWRQVLTSHVDDGRGLCRECGDGPWPCDLQRIARDAQLLAQPRRRSRRHTEPRFVEQPRPPQHRADPDPARRLRRRGTVRGRPAVPPAVFLQPGLPEPRPATTWSNPRPHRSGVMATASSAAHLVRVA